MMKTLARVAQELMGRGAVVKPLSSRAELILKISYSPSPDARFWRQDKGFGDLLSSSPVHTDARDGEDYDGGVKARRGKTLRCVFAEDIWIIYIGKSHGPMLFTAFDVVYSIIVGF